MKVCKTVLAITALLFFFSLSPGFGGDKKNFPTSPPEKIAKKFRIGYLEGGPYKSYQKTLVSVVNGLADLGWIEPLTVPPQEDIHDTVKLWAWLGKNVKSRYLEFPADAHYSFGWDKKTRAEQKKLVIKRLKESGGIDLMLALGTWAGQDLANDGHSTPTIVCDSSDAVSAKIIKSVEDSGFDHLHARMDPTKYRRQIIAFHDVIGFKKVGLPYLDTVYGKSVAAINDFESLSKKLGFEIVPCHTLGGKSDEANDKIVACAKELAPKVDAYYLSESAALNKKTLPKIMDALNAHKIPSFSQGGSDEVKKGVLLSVASSYKGVGRFHAETIAKVANGAKPRDLDQVFSPPVKLAVNLAEAIIIGLDPETYDLLSNTAEEVYETVEKGEN